MDIGEVCVVKGAAQKPEELNKLLEFLPFGRGGTVLEIGHGEGGTCWFWHYAGYERIVTVDIRTEPSHNLPPGVECVFAANSRSDNTRARIFSDVGPVNVLFIDGDHSYEGCWSDFVNYWDLVAPGGICAFHDIVYHPGVPDCQVNKVWAELEASNLKTWEIITPPDHWGGIGIVWKPGGK